MTPLADYIDMIRLLAPSLVTAAAVAFAGSLVGVFVLLRREALAALALPHVVAVGAAVGLRFGWPTLPPALVVVIGAVLLLASGKRRGTQNWLLPSLYIAGLCLSFLIIANSGQHVADLQNLFTGMDVAVSPREAAIAVPVLLATGSVCAALWRRWLLLAQSSTTAEVAGLCPWRWEAGFLCLLSCVVLLGTNDLGVVLVLVMLFLPAACVMPWAKRIPAALALSCVTGLVFLAAGFVMSVEESLPLSQSIGGVGFAALMLSHAAAAVKK